MGEDEAAPAARLCGWCHDVMDPEEEAIEIECSTCEAYFVHRECVRTASKTLLALVIVCTGSMSIEIAPAMAGACPTTW